MKTTRPRPHPEMAEGQEAFDRFQEAVRAVLRVPKSALPPSPFRNTNETGAAFIKQTLTSGARVGSRGKL